MFEVLDFISCCGIRVYFQIPTSLLPSYGNVDDTYVYNGPPVADAEGTIMYPGQCYYITQKGGSFVTPRPTAPLPIFFGPIVGTYPTSCDSQACNHCFYKLQDCFNPSNIIISYANLSAYLNQIITIADQPGCYLVTETELSEPTPVNVYPLQSFAGCEKCTFKTVMFTSCCGFTAYFAIDVNTPYLSEGNVYIYNGEPITDGFGNTLYPNICYSFNSITSVEGTVDAPPFASFSTSQGLTCEVSACRNCFYLLTDCDDPSNTITTYTNLSAYLGQVINIQNSDKCWTVTSTTVINNPVAVIFDDSFSSCPCCKGYYFTLNDCCTNEPYQVDGIALVLYYRCDSNPGVAPSDLSSVVITNITNDFGNDIPDGCYKLTEIDINSLANRPGILNWQQTVQTVSTVDTCEECENCVTCYLLTNCENEDEIVVTNTDLSDYINHVISIKGCDDKCWIVTESEDCDNCTGKVEIIKDCPPIESDSGKLCSYIVSGIETNDLVSYSITINGTLYPFTFNPGDDVETVLDNFNSLNLGYFTVSTIGSDSAYYVAGSEDYGPLCYTVCLVDCSETETICINPVCEEQETQCVYPPLAVQDASGFYTIEIDSVTYTSPTFPNLNNPGGLVVWLNSLNKGIFTITYTPLPGRQVTVYVYGTHVYGQLTLSIIGGPTISVNKVCIPLGPLLPDCACCLPQPVPEPPLVLKTRFIKPGYTTPVCSPQYTEKVNCNYGDQMYNRMLAVRYGLKTCCDESYDKWLIKKELLDLASITNPEFQCCPPVTCQSCNQQNCDCPIIN